MITIIIAKIPTKIIGNILTKSSFARICAKVPPIATQIVSTAPINSVIGNQNPSINKITIII